MGEVMNGFMQKGSFELLLGRVTYEHMAAHWPDAPAEEQPEVMNSARKHVATRTLDGTEWENSTVIEGDVAEFVRGLKSEDGPEIQVHGSGRLVQTLLEADLVDEFRLWIYPVLLGEGKRLFADGTAPAGLKLVETRTARTGPSSLGTNAAVTSRRGRSWAADNRASDDGRQKPDVAVEPTPQPIARLTNPRAVVRESPTLSPESSPATSQPWPCLGPARPT
jgi:dihydrofolate reductase